MSIKVKQRNAQPVSRLLANSPQKNSGKNELAPLLGKADAIARAQQQLESKLPDELKGHLLVGGYTENNLTILTDKAVWLTWLRFERARLLKLINALPELQHITAITFKVRPLRSVRPTIRQARYISQAASSHLKECADYTDNPALKAALERLSTRTLAEPTDDAQ